MEVPDYSLPPIRDLRTEEPVANVDEPFDDFSPPESGGGGGGSPKLWDVPLTGLMVDPFTLAAKVLEDTSTNWQNAIPNEGDLSNILSNIFSGLTRESNSPGSIAGVIEGLFSSIEGVVGGVHTSVSTILSNFAPIAGTLSANFNTLEKRPSDGDYIYTDEFGIVYTIFKKQATPPAGIATPTGNLIFRVEFDVTIDEVVTTHVAITTFPSPDVGRLLSVLLGYVVNFIKQITGAAVSALASMVFDGIVAGLNALFTELKELLDELETALRALIAALQAELDTLTATVAALADSLQNEISNLQGQLDTLQSAIDGLNGRMNALELAMDALQAALDAIDLDPADFVTITVIGADGKYNTIKVLESTAGATAEREITWIDSDTGFGKRGKVIVAQNAPVPTPNVADVSWRKIDYVHPGGRTYTMHCLVRVANTVSGLPTYNGSEPSDTSDWPNYEITDLIIVDKATNTAKEVQSLLLPKESLPEGTNPAS